MARHASVTPRGARRADGPELPQLPRSLHPGRGAAAIVADLHLSGTQAGSLQLAFILTFAVDLAGVRLAGRPASAVSAGGHRRLRLERRHRSASGLATTFALLLLARAPDRRRRGELHGRHAVPDLGLLPGRAARASAGPLLRGDPDRIRASASWSAARSMPTGAGGRRSSSRERPARRWRPSCSCSGIRTAARSTRSRRSVPGTVRDTFAALRARPSFFFNTVAQIIYTFAVGGLAFWMPTYFVEVRRLPLRRRGAQLRARPGAGRVRRNADRRTRGRCARAPSLRRPLPAVGRCLRRVAAVHAARDPAPLACYLLAGDVHDAAAVLHQHRPAERGDGERAAARAARPRLRDQHHGDPRARRRAVAAADRRRERPPRARPRPCWSPACWWCVAGLVLLAGCRALRRDLQAAAVAA